MTKSAVRAAAIGVVVGLLAACTAGEPIGGGNLQGADETGQMSDQLAGGVPVGTTLVTTANLNLRSGSSTSDSILHVIPQGASVVTVNQTDPVDGFYNVEHAGVEGWAYGAYLATQTTNPNTPTSGDVQDAITRATEGLGFSYWWGHGRWLDTGVTQSNAGTCSGSCPSCSHGGSYGADCSGYVAKIWQVPSDNTDLAADSHPYSTYNFRYETHGWHQISRSDLQTGDALVYHSGSSGHIYIFDHGDPWGSHWAYEAKGCSYGIVHDVRTASSSYIAIRHDGW